MPGEMSFITAKGSTFGSLEDIPSTTFQVLVEAILQTRVLMAFPAPVSFDSRICSVIYPKLFYDWNFFLLLSVIDVPCVSFDSSSLTPFSYHAFHQRNPG